MATVYGSTDPDKHSQIVFVRTESTLQMILWQYTKVFESLEWHSSPQPIQYWAPAEAALATKWRKATIVHKGYQSAKMMVKWKPLQPSQIAPVRVSIACALSEHLSPPSLHPNTVVS